MRIISNRKRLAGVAFLVGFFRKSLAGVAFLVGFFVARLLDSPMPCHFAQPLDTLSPQATAGVGIILEKQRVTWNPEESSKCSFKNNSIPDPFPPNFDPVVYQERNHKHESSATLDLNHYNTIGREQGLMCTRGQEIRQIINQDIATALKGAILEIGPFLNPTVTAKNVKYFDVLDLEGLKSRAREIGYPVRKEVEIDYVHPTGDLGSVKDTFEMVVSSHVIEHQLDLVRHFTAVSKILRPGGYYVTLVPDKRFCFDAHIAESTIAEVLDDYFTNRSDTGAHKLKSVIEHRALTTHNNAAKHWAGDDGPTYSANVVQRIQGAIAEYQAGQRNSKYVDVHNYQLTPQSLAFLVTTLYSLDLIDLCVHRLYETIKGQLEFSIVLKKCPKNML